MQNEKVNILVLEDDGIVGLGLEDTLHTQGYHVAGLADNGREALEIMKKDSIDLALLDIHVKGDWDGVETAEKIAGIKDIPFIYLTAFSDDETISRARNTAPSAYLVKPYQPQSLLIAIDLALHNFNFKKAFPEKECKVSPGENPSFQEQKDDLLVFNHTIFIKHNYRFFKIIPDNILHLEATGNHTRIHTSEKKYIVRYSLQSLLEKINFPFLVQVHRSFAVNLQQLSSFDSNSIFVGQTEIPLGRLYKEEFYYRLQSL